MATVKMYTKETCPHCNAAKALLDDMGQEYEDVDVNAHPDERERVMEENGGYPTVPMIFVNGKFIGGNSELQELAQSGELNAMLADGDSSDSDDSE